MLCRYCSFVFYLSTSLSLRLQGFDLGGLFFDRQRSLLTQLFIIFTVIVNVQRGEGRRCGGGVQSLIDAIELVQVLRIPPFALLELINAGIVAMLGIFFRVSFMRRYEIDLVEHVIYGMNEL